MPKRISKRKVLIGVIILILVFVMIYSGLRILKPTVSLNTPEAEQGVIPSKTVEYNGVKYFPRQDITVFLVAGIDQSGPVKDSGSYNNDGAADVVMLAIFDETAKSYDILCLNRDTIVEMPILGLGGKKAGTAMGQLALAHTYGSGLEDSCLNLKETVSDLLGGIKIDYYLSMNMDAIGLMNDAVGGVRVNITDDFSAIDPTLQKGEMVLNAAQARTFVQTRQGLGDQLNLSRMERHREYMNGLTDALSEKIRSGGSFVLETFEQIGPYIVTDCSVNSLSSMLNRYADYTGGDIISPKGENKVGTEFMEYYVDEEQLKLLVLDLFYAEK